MNEYNKTIKMVVGLVAVAALVVLVVVGATPITDIPTSDESADDLPSESTIISELNTTQNYTSELKISRVIFDTPSSDGASDTTPQLQTTYSATVWYTDEVSEKHDVTTPPSDPNRGIATLSSGDILIDDFKTDNTTRYSNQTDVDTNIYTESNIGDVVGEPIIRQDWLYTASNIGSVSVEGVAERNGYDTYEVEITLANLSSDELTQLDTPQGPLSEPTLTAEFAEIDKNISNINVENNITISAHLTQENIFPLHTEITTTDGEIIYEKQHTNLSFTVDERGDYTNRNG